jgi:hypothetical protein
MLRRLTALGLVIAALGATSASAQGHSWHLGRWDPGIHNVQNAVYYAFCGHQYRECGLGDQAWRVAGCETGRTYSTWAENGQYKNIFQMGTHERELFGWHTVGSSPWVAAKSAKSYYDYEVRHGYWGWHPWSCHP